MTKQYFNTLEELGFNPYSEEFQKAIKTDGVFVMGINAGMSAEELCYLLLKLRKDMIDEHIKYVAKCTCGIKPIEKKESDG